MSYHLLHQSWWGLGCLRTANSRTEAPLFVPEIPSPNIPYRESMPMGFGRGRSRDVWAPQVIVPQDLVMGEVFVEDSLTQMAVLEEDEIQGLRENNQGSSNGRGTGQGQEPSPQNNRNGNSNGRARDLRTVGFPPFGRNVQTDEQITSHGRGRKLNSGNPLSLRRRG